MALFEKKEKDPFEILMQHKVYKYLMDRYDRYTSGIWHVSHVIYNSDPYKDSITKTIGFYDGELIDVLKYIAPIPTVRSVLPFLNVDLVQAKKVDTYVIKEREKKVDEIKKLNEEIEKLKSEL